MSCRFVDTTLLWLGSFLNTIVLFNVSWTLKPYTFRQDSPGSTIVSGPWGHSQDSLPSPWAPPTCPCPRTPCQPHRPSVPSWQCCSRASLHLPTALLHPAMGPAEPGSPVGPCLVLALACLHHQEGWPLPSPQMPLVLPGCLTSLNWAHKEQLPSAASWQYSPCNCPGSCMDYPGILSSSEPLTDLAYLI